MNKGKILKIRPGHDANCSAYAYMGGVLVGLFGYALLFGIQAFVLLPSWPRRLGSKLALMAFWFIPQVLALAVFLYWAYTSGAMAYGSVICVGPLALVMLVGMVGGWDIIAKRSPALLAKRLPPEVLQAAHYCPSCSADVAVSDLKCPFCGYDLASSREQTDGSGK